MEKRVLDHVFGMSIVAQYATGKGKRSREVGTDQRAKGVAIALAGSLDKR